MSQIKAVQIIATFTPEQITAPGFADMLRVGVDIVRVNASHCNIASLEVISPILKQYPVKSLLDLPGAEHRLRGLSAALSLACGDTLTLGNDTGVGITGVCDYSHIKTGTRATFVNAETHATVVEADSRCITLTFPSGGFLPPNCHVHFPGSDVDAAPDQDFEQRLISLACGMQWDFVALSMIHSLEDVQYYKTLIETLQPRRKPDIIAKFETVASLNDMDAIITAVDAVFVARGDLGHCVPLPQIPVWQKRIISRCVTLGKKAFVATQMLSSMTRGTAPTRAEVSDVANAVWDGADALTLSEETAIGVNPAASIAMMADIIRTASEHSELYRACVADIHPPNWPFPINPAIDMLLFQIADISRRIWDRGWAEANAGNLSVNITDMIPESNRSHSQWYLVSRSGSRYRQMASNPLQSLVLIQVDESEHTRYPADARPTSEWSSHCGLQQSLNDPSRRFILHAHPSPVIAISQTPLYDNSELLNRTLASILPEMPLYLPQGIACGPHLQPGSDELAHSSVSVIGERKVLIWQKHGILCCGKDPDEAFDYLEIVTKAAQVWLKLQSITQVTHFS